MININYRGFLIYQEPNQCKAQGGQIKNKMNTRKVKYKPNETISPCPKCGNNTEFTVHSDYCAEDCCEVWAVCKCGFDPTAEGKGWGNRYEDVWGGCSDENCQAALLCSWNETIELLEA